MIVLDEQLRRVGLEEAIARWYRGRVCFIDSLRPASIVKDDAVPQLLRSARHCTFVTQNWKHFWQRTPPHSDYLVRLGWASPALPGTRR